jgi:hypothetical protein
MPTPAPPPPPPPPPPPAPDAPPTAPKVAEDKVNEQAGATAKKRGTSSLRIDLNPGVRTGTGLQIPGR